MSTHPASAEPARITIVESGACHFCEDAQLVLDDGTVSDAYGTSARACTPASPGHSFVLIDADGHQRWYGEYPSMWLDPTELLEKVRNRLAA